MKLNEGRNGFIMFSILILPPLIRDVWKLWSFFFFCLSYEIHNLSSVGSKVWRIISAKISKGLSSFAFLLFLNFVYGF